MGVNDSLSEQRNLDHSELTDDKYWYFFYFQENMASHFVKYFLRKKKCV